MPSKLIARDPIVSVARAKCTVCDHVGPCRMEADHYDDCTIRFFQCKDRAACDERAFGGPPTTCSHCGGTGLFRWGPISNGKASNEGQCFRCAGTGTLTAEDRRRNYWYDMKYRRINL